MFYGECFIFDYQTPLLSDWEIKKIKSKLPSADMINIYDTYLQNHATNFGMYSVDGCRDFTKKGDNGTKEEYICADCGRFKTLFFYPHVNPHGGGNVPVIIYP
uniref:ZF-HD dimerization-type domain-containing protein n=1 Tax=Solanum lycopersicum TaxID=4081 RepID=A0A3Q7GF55_SOLLC